jgi:hypothetical protein
MPRFCQVHTILPSTQKGAGTSYSDSYDAGEFIEALILTNITAVSGSTQAYDVTLQQSPDDSVWFDRDDTFARLTGVSKQVVKITNFGRYLRLKFVVGGTGTPKVTATVQLVGKD